MTSDGGFVRRYMAILNQSHPQDRLETFGICQPIGSLDSVTCHVSLITLK